MKIHLNFILFILYYYHPIKCAQPYFPPQIVFSPGSQTIYGIDEINQQAFRTVSFGTTRRVSGFVMKQFPYAIPDSPESKYYVQLVVDSAPFSCMYEAYAEYDGDPFTLFTLFPREWLNGTSFYIGNFISFKYQMIHSTNSSQDEDYWFSDETCQVDGEDTYPCEEIYFKKGTEIPLRSTLIIGVDPFVIPITTNYQIISMGKIDEKYFDTIPKNWSLICRDVNLGLLISSQAIKLDVGESARVQVSLRTQPHRINGNDTVTIQWQSMGCQDCFTWIPEKLSFNIKNFHEKQRLTITRVKDSPETTLQPIFNGGGFDLVEPQRYSIYIE